MSQTVITSAFEQLKAQQAVTGEAVVLDGFIFANVPNLDISSPIDPNEAIPPDAQIVHRADVALTGVVNDNAVVYSVTLGTAVGDFDFNWVGLVNKTSNVLAMIVHAPVQSKVANAAGVQGNVLTRSFLMEYDGAKKQTNITTPAQTWQIDFTARLDGIDERQRLENADIYGAAAFFGDGWLVGKTGNQFFVTKGTGYVAGLRTSLAENQNITVTTKPVKVWLDVCWTGALTSVWNAQSKITVAENLADYVQNGVQHYVFAVASIDVNGNITDLRPKGTLNEQQASDALKKHEQSRNHPDASTSEKGFAQLSSATDSASEELAATSKAVKIAMDNANARLAKERNGADIPNPQLFVQNIGLQDTVNKAAGALQKDQNLADIPDKAKARAALQLGTVTTLDVTSSATDDTTGRVLTVGYQGIGGNAGPLTKGDFNQLSPSGFINGQTNGPNNPTLYIGFNVRHANAYQFTLVGRQQRYFAQCCEAGAFKGWDEFYTTAHKPTAADVGALPITGGALSGSLGIGVANALGGNSIVLGDNDTGFKQEGDGILNVYANSVLVMRFISSIIESLKPLKVNGSCIATSEIQAGNGAVRLAVDGNVYGTTWGGWLRDYLAATFQPKGNFTPAGQAYTKAESDARYIQSMRLGSAISTTWWANGGDCPAGHVLTGGDFNDDKSYVQYKPVQVLINGQWVTISG
ncbi:phage tail-collar fiber domain-containing protein [Citrobacter braakii]|uniref:phage tail-collar fiber domain-containing protein n=1 Tax=Citrobacter braakii TaxID=57706 RepID=UPI001C7CFF51|nr:phage tail protein [Citrobacter braakii]